jgi:hypothetical protein
MFSRVKKDTISSSSEPQSCEKSMQINICGVPRTKIPVIQSIAKMIPNFGSIVLGMQDLKVTHKTMAVSQDNSENQVVNISVTNVSAEAMEWDNLALFIDILKNKIVEDLGLNTFEGQISSAIDAITVDQYGNNLILDCSALALALVPASASSSSDSSSSIQHKLYDPLKLNNYNPTESLTKGELRWIRPEPVSRDMGRPKGTRAYYLMDFPLSQIDEYMELKQTIFTKKFAALFKGTNPLVETINVSGNIQVFVAYNLLSSGQEFLAQVAALDQIDISQMMHQEKKELLLVEEDLTKSSPSQRNTPLQQFFQRIFTALSSSQLAQPQEQEIVETRSRRRHIEVEKQGVEMQEESKEGQQRVPAPQPPSFDVVVPADSEGFSDEAGVKEATSPSPISSSSLPNATTSNLSSDGLTGLTTTANDSKKKEKGIFSWLMKRKGEKKKPANTSSSFNVDASSSLSTQTQSEQISPQPPVVGPWKSTATLTLLSEKQLQESATKRLPAQDLCVLDDEGLGF